jgi:DNA polymerase-3 subunit alpha
VWNVADNDHDFVMKLTAALEPFKGGGCPVGISYSSEVAKANLQLGDEWRVHPTDELVARLKSMLGSEAVEVRYR